MSRFAIRNPYLIVVICLIVAVVGVTTLLRMPVDMFPPMNIPVVVVATFYNGMPPEQVEADITSRFERFFTLASGIEHIESRSLPGVSVIKVYFQPGSNPDSAVTSISNLAMAQLRRLPPGTLPPLVLKFDASSLPVCLVTLKGDGLNETTLRDLAQFQVRNQLAAVPGASVPQPFGGRYRQIMVYTDPFKLEAHHLSPMDVVRAVNDSNLILPAGDVQIGQRDYNIYTNSQLASVNEVNQLPIKTSGQSPVRVEDIGHAADAQQIQTNIVRVDGQKSVYIPILKQGGDTNTISVVEGVRHALQHLLDTPKQMAAKVVFDQSVFVKTAIETLLHEGGIGLLLTSIMILIFLGSMRATLAVYFSIPLSALMAFILLGMGGGTVNAMVLGGLALAFSRLIDNSVVVLENIFRHLEMGSSQERAAEEGGREVALPVLASTLTAIVVFFPVTLLYGVSKYLFMALALAVVLALLASYFVAMSVVPLFCSRFIHGHQGAGDHGSPHHRPRGFNAVFNRGFEAFLRVYDGVIGVVLKRPVAVLVLLGGIIAAGAALYPMLDFSFFPRTDPAQFVINLKLPSGTRIGVTDQEVGKIEQIVRQTVSPGDLRMIVSNIGSVPGFSAIYTSNSGMHTATVQVSLKQDHKTGSYDYMEQVRRRLAREMPEVSAYFQSGGLVDAVLGMGMAAPIDVQVSGTDIDSSYHVAQQLARQIGRVPGVGSVFVPQDVDYPALQLKVDRVRAQELGLTQKEVVDNVITALTSNGMIAPSYWIDPKTGNDYMLTVQYPENQIRTLDDLRAIPIRGKGIPDSTRLDNVATITQMQSPTEVDHYGLRRVTDIYVQPRGEGIGRISTAIDQIAAKTSLPDGITVTQRGLVQGMRQSFHSFYIGLALSVVLLYLILVAQFRSFRDPILILTAVPPGLAGALLALYLTGSTMNVMSLMGLMILIGMTVSDSILIVEFTRHLRENGMSVREAVATAARVRLRPVLMTSLATIMGLLPMALKLGNGSESYAPLARAVLGGMSVSLVMTVILVPAAYYAVYRKHDRTQPGGLEVGQVPTCAPLRQVGA
jgi:multidrug efflux pump subunit AcrB